MNFINFLSAASNTASNQPTMGWHPEKILDQLPRMGIGMLLICILIGAIILTTALINKIFSSKK